MRGTPAHDRRFPPDRPTAPPPAQLDIERQIIEACEKLDDCVASYADVARDAAVADADYRYRRATATISLANDGEKRTVALASAIVDVHTDDDYRASETLAAARDSLREAMRSHRTRIDALRTLAANQRAAIHGS